MSLLITERLLLIKVLVCSLCSIFQPDFDAFKINNCVVRKVSNELKSSCISNNLT